MSWYMQRTLPAWNTSWIKSLPKYWVIFIKTRKTGMLFGIHCQKGNETVHFGDHTHLRGIRGTAVGVEAAVMTCRICSKADRPPPTWKATWFALFCWAKDTETGLQSGDNEDPADRGLHGSQRKGNLFPLLQSWGSKISNKVVPQVFLFNLKSAQNDSTPQQSSFTLRQLVCRL